MNEVSKLIDRTITEAVLDSTVTSIGRYAFYGCSKLKELHFINNTPPTINGQPWYGLKYVYVPEGSVEAYRTAFIGKIYPNSYGGAAIDPSTFVFAYQVPSWEIQTFECEVDETDTKTGMVTVVEKDTNPTSSTYGQTRQRTYEDLKRCNPVSGFTKITSLDEATSGKYLIVDTANNIALNASLIASTTSTSDGINAFGNHISVGITDDTIEATDTTLNAAVDYDADNQTLSWTDENTKIYYLSPDRGANFNTSTSDRQDFVTPYLNINDGITFESFSTHRAIALYTNTYNNSKFRWQPKNTNSNFANVALFKLN